MNNNLHAEIMNLPVKVDWPEDTDSVEIWGYKVGHRDARHAAAELAIKQDALINELLEIAELVIDLDSPEDMSTLFNMASKVIAKAKGETNYE